MDTRNENLESQGRKPCDFLVERIRKSLAPFYREFDIAFDEGNYMEESSDHPSILIILKGQEKDLHKMTMENIILDARCENYYLVNIEGLPTKQTILTFENK